MNYQNGYNLAGFGHPPPQQFAQNAGNNTQQFPPQAFAAQAHQQQQRPPPQQQQQPFGPGQLSPAQHQQQQHQHQQPHPQYAGNMAMGGMGFDMGPAAGMGAGGPMMMPGGPHPQMTGQQSPFTSAPYAQMPLASTSGTPLPSQQQHPQHPSLQHQSSSAHQTSASPSGHASPPNQNQPQRQLHSSMSKQQPQSGASQPASAGAPPNQPPNASHNTQQPPLSPASKEREKERVSLLLLINSDLIKEVVKLQGEGKAGIPEQAQKDAPNGKDGADDAQLKAKKAQPHPEYIECMRRLQANLGYLAAIADRSHKPAAAVPTSPAILVAPEKMPQLMDPYKRLLALFPGAPHVHKTQNASAKPNPQQPGNPQMNQSRPQQKQGTPQAPGRSGPDSLSAIPAGSTPAEQNYKRWLEQMRKTSPQKGSQDRDQASGEMGR